METARVRERGSSLDRGIEPDEDQLGERDYSEDFVRVPRYVRIRGAGNRGPTIRRIARRHELEEFDVPPSEKLEDEEEKAYTQQLQLWVHRRLRHDWSFDPDRTYKSGVHANVWGTRWAIREDWADDVTGLQENADSTWLPHQAVAPQYSDEDDDDEQSPPPGKRRRLCPVRGRPRRPLPTIGAEYWHRQRDAWTEAEHHRIVPASPPESDDATFQAQGLDNIPRWGPRRAPSPKRRGQPPLSYININGKSHAMRGHILDIFARRLPTSDCPNPWGEVNYRKERDANLGPFLTMTPRPTDSSLVTENPYPKAQCPKQITLLPVPAKSLFIPGNPAHQVHLSRQQRAALYHGMIKERHKPRSPVPLGLMIEVIVQGWKKDGVWDEHQAAARESEPPIPNPRNSNRRPYQHRRTSGRSNIKPTTSFELPFPKIDSRSVTRQLAKAKSRTTIIIDLSATDDDEAQRIAQNRQLTVTGTTVATDSSQPKAYAKEHSQKKAAHGPSKRRKDVHQNLPAKEAVQNPKQNEPAIQRQPAGVITRARKRTLDEVGGSQGVDTRLHSLSSEFGARA